MHANDEAPDEFSLSCDVCGTDIDVDFHIKIIIFYSFEKILNVFSSLNVLSFQKYIDDNFISKKGNIK